MCRSSVSTQSVVQKPADHFSHSLDLAARLVAVEGLGVLHADPLSVRCVQERRHAVVAVVRIRAHSTDPRPVEVFDQFGQRVGLELVTGNCPEETRVLLLVGEAGARGKVAHLEQHSGILHLQKQP